MSRVSLPLFNYAIEMQEMQCQCGNGLIAFCRVARSFQLRFEVERLVFFFKMTRV